MTRSPSPPGMAPPRFEASPCALFTTDRQGRILDANALARCWLAAQQLPDQDARISQLLSAGSAAYFEIFLRPLLTATSAFREIATRVKTDVGEVEALWSATLQTRDGADCIEHSIFPAVHRRLYEQELAAITSRAATQGSLLAQIEKIAGIGTWTFELASRKASWSDQLRALAGLPATGTPGLRQALGFFPPAERLRVWRMIARTMRQGGRFLVEADARDATGAQRRVRLMGELTRDESGQQRIVGVVYDITHAHLATQTLWQSANYDMLTQLPNRRLFTSYLQDCVDVEHPFALVLLDLDRFKEINDTEGHQRGDAVLKEVAARIAIHPGIRFSSRLGGDEFALVIDQQDRDDTLAVVEAIGADIRRPIMADGVALRVEVSAGIACYPDDAAGCDALLKCADLALNHVKGAGRGGSAVYVPDFASRFDKRRHAVATVIGAADQGRIRPFYQPKVALRDGRVIGYEALVRIDEARGRLLTPGDFWPALNEPDSAKRLQRAMLEAVLGDIHREAACGRVLAPVSINVSQYCLETSAVTDRMLELVAQGVIAPSAIELEITEVVLLGDGVGSVADNLDRLHRAGFRIALDDFGTGFASLTHLRDFPIDCIKIDKSFVLGLGQQGNTAIIKSIVDLSHTLDKTVVAEGVETEAQRDFLASIRCDAGQGYLFGRPAPAAQAFAPSAGRAVSAA